MPESGRRPGGLEGASYKGPKVGPNTQAAMDKLPREAVLTKKDVFKSDTELSLELMEHRLERRIIQMCLVSGAIGAISGFLIFVLVGVII